MEQHKSNIQELLECLSLISEDDFRDMSQAFKSESLMLSGSAMAFGNVFLLMELIKEIKELKSIMKEYTKPREEVSTNEELKYETGDFQDSQVETMLINKMTSSLDNTAKDIENFDKAIKKSGEIFLEKEKEIEKKQEETKKEPITPTTPKKKKAGRPKKEKETTEG